MARMCIGKVHISCMTRWPCCVGCGQPSALASLSHKPRRPIFGNHAQKLSNTDFASSSSAPVLQLAHPFSSAMVSTQGQDTDLDLLAAARRPRAAFQQFVSRPYSQWSGPVLPISSDARSQLATQLGGNDAWGPESPMLSPIGIQARCPWRWLPLSHRIGGSHGFFEENSMKPEHSVEGR